MTRLQTDSEASAVVAHRLVAGLDLLSTSERDADELAHRVAHALASAGAEDVTAATHWAQVDGFHHVAVSVDVAGTDADILEAVLSDIVPLDNSDGGSALLVGGSFTGDAALANTIAAAVEAHRTRSGGRIVVFPGCTRLTGTVSVRAVLAGSAVDRVRVLTAGDAEPDTMLVTRAFLRPRWREGQLVLDVQPAVGGTLVPFETPFPTPCCVVHG